MQHTVIKNSETAKFPAYISEVTWQPQTNQNNTEAQRCEHMVKWSNKPCYTTKNSCFGNTKKLFRDKFLSSCEARIPPYNHTSCL